MVRQAGLDLARGDYVMFCDADDTLHNVGVIGAFLKYARDVPDMLVSQWYEELPTDDGYSYLARGFENTWMHGKMFRREFLSNNGIRHHPELRVHEDSYFLAVASAYKPKVERISAITYVWRYSPSSITRSDNALYSYSSIPKFVRAISLSWDRVAAANPESLPERVYQLVCYLYFMTQSGKWQTDFAEPYRHAAELSLSSEMGGKEWSAFYAIAPETAVSVYLQELGKVGSDFHEKAPFADWIAVIKQGSVPF
jgi:hypothetical protein